MQQTGSQSAKGDVCFDVLLVLRLVDGARGIAVRTKADKPVEQKYVSFFWTRPQHGWIKEFDNNLSIVGIFKYPIPVRRSNGPA